MEGDISMSVIFDTKDFDSKTASYLVKIQKARGKATMDVGYEVLRLGMHEVPHKKGLLETSGKVEPIGDGRAEVGYNKTYAAYQHEGRRSDGSHVIRHYNFGRKGKFLEDPIKQNLSTLRDYMSEVINKFIHT